GGGGGGGAGGGGGSAMAGVLGGLSGELDWVVVLGDRVEALAGAAAAAVGGVRVAHLHGGDRAEGVADESMRHAISKLAHVHLAATEASAARLVRMGEAEAAVVVVGSPAMDGLAGVAAEAGGPEVVVMQHPIGAGDDEERAWMAGTLAAAGEVGAARGWRVVAMSPNGDPGRAGVAAAIDAAGVERVDHLGREAWLSRLKGAQVLVGNSSAGLIEAAALGTAVVNVGPRQGGREWAGRLVDCDYGAAAVGAAIERALALPAEAGGHPYGDGRTGVRVAELLATADVSVWPVRKRNTY
ncbi:MAG: UDP-N-acetylglucosamine 2-epimerase, partial [Planctomycetota bacterium]